MSTGAVEHEFFTSQSHLNSFREPGSGCPYPKCLELPFLDFRVGSIPGSDVAWGARHCAGVKKKPCTGTYYGKSSTKATMEMQWKVTPARREGGRQQERKRHRKIEGSSSWWDALEGRKTVCGQQRATAQLLA